MRAVVIGALLVLVLVAVPAVFNSFWLATSTSVAIYSVAALGAGFLYGRVGMVSLCQIALLAIGGWVTLRLGLATSLPFPVLLLIAGVVTAVLGTLIGLPALRLSGLHLALITLMFAAAISLVLGKKQFPNGSSGFWGYGSTVFSANQLGRPEIARSDAAYFRYTVIVASLMFLLVLLHIAGKPGRAWAAIRESEPAALAAGVNMTLYKLWAFTLASFVTGVAGGLLAGSVQALASTQFPTTDSIILLAVVLMGGIYSLWGAVVAGLLFKFLPALLHDNWGLPTQLATILFGVGILQVLTTAPGGIVTQLPKDLANLGRLVARGARRVTGARSGAA